MVVRDSGRGQYVEQWDRVIEKGQLKSLHCWERAAG